jgi:hypothetical protein
MKTVLGIAHCLSGGQNPEAYKEKAFAITSTLQAAFLRRDLMKDCLNVDMQDKAQRKDFIDRLVERFK